MQGEHTPGPWLITEGHRNRIIMAGEDVVAEVHWWAMEDAPASLANARLIAAAPELLTTGQALQAARERHRLNATRENADAVYAASEAFDAAIAKATNAGGT